MSFENRTDAGRQLARRLDALEPERPVVVGMARGGVPVAKEVASRLGAPLDVLVVRKVGAPFHPEYAIGAVARGVLRLDERAIALLAVPRAEVDAIVATETETLERREALYRSGRPAVDVRGRTVVLVDDGLATGMSARAAIAALRACGPGRVVFGSPVCARDSADALRGVADDVICAVTPRTFRAVGQWYRDFAPTTDAEVIAILQEAAGTDAATSAGKQP